MQTEHRPAEPSAHGRDSLCQHRRQRREDLERLVRVRPPQALHEPMPQDQRPHPTHRHDRCRPGSRVPQEGDLPDGSAENVFLQSGSGDWLAEVRGEMAIVVSERRPVPLYQHVVAGRRLYDLFAETAPTALPPAPAAPAPVAAFLNGESTPANSLAASLA